MLKVMVKICFIICIAYSKLLTELKLNHINQQETILNFDFQNEDIIDFTQLLQKQPLLSRSFLENLHIHGNVRKLYISVGLGRLGKAPHGSLFISNADINQKLVVNQLSEIFRISRKNLHGDHEYFMRFSNNEQMVIEDGIVFDEDEFILAQDPTDIICIDGIQKIKELLGCRGKKGLLALIDQNHIFQSSAITVKAFFEYDSIRHIARQRFIIQAQILSKNINKILISDGGNIQTCPLHDSAIVYHSNREQKFDFLQAQVMPIGYLYRKETDIAEIIKEEDFIEQKRYVTGEWFNFQSEVIQWVKSKQSGNITIYLYLQSDFVPLFATMKIGVYKNNILIREDFQKHITFSEHFKQIKIEGRLETDEMVQIRVKIDKRMKSFEEYPHDPERGHDIVTINISSPIIFTPDGQKQSQIYLSENQVTRLPAPDFSMPFNILTFTSLTLGYYFLQILRLTIDKFEIDKEEKGSLAQRLFRKLWVAIFGAEEQTKVKSD